MVIYAFAITVIFIIFPALLILLVKQLSYLANEKLVNTFGFNSQIYVGGLGVIIHELSHLLLALIFLHHIDSVCLLRIPNHNDISDKSLGYVRHSWSSRSIYQTIGNVFIGTAPVICGVLIIFLILSKLNPTFASLHSSIAQQIISNQGIINADTFRLFLSSLGQFFQIHLTSVPAIIFELISITSICFGGFDLSHVDLQASKYAFISLVVLTFGISLLVPVLSMQASLMPLFVNVAVWIYLLFFISIFILLVLNLVMFILKMIF